jgi:hypothetical protein
MMIKVMEKNLDVKKSQRWTFFVMEMDMEEVCDLRIDVLS